MSGHDLDPIEVRRDSSGALTAVIRSPDPSLVDIVTPTDVTKVSLMYEAVTPRLVDQLGRFGDHLVEIELYPTSEAAPSDDVLGALQAVTGLHCLRLSSRGEYKISTSALRKLTQLQRLRTLSINGFPGLGHGLDVLADMPRLRWLELRYSLMTVKEMHLVADAKQIEHFDPSNSDIYYDELWPLIGHPNLQGIFAYGLKRTPGSRPAEFHRMLSGLPALNDYQGASLPLLLRWRLRSRGVRVLETDRFERGQAMWGMVG